MKHDTTYLHIYEHIYTKTKEERVFMMKSFIFHIQNNSFHDTVISLVLYRKVLQPTLFSTLLTNQNWHVSTNNTTCRHIDAPTIMGRSAALHVSERY